MKSNSAWHIEIWRLIVLACVSLAFGFSTGYWAPSIILPGIAYLIWLQYQLYRLDKWMSEGAKNRTIPASSGVWELVATQVLRWRKLEKGHKKRLTKIAKGYRNAVLALPDAVLVLNTNLEIEWGNSTADKLLGINRYTDAGYRISNLIRDPKFVQYLSQSGTSTLEMESPSNPELILSIRVIQYGQDQRLLVARDISERVRARNTLQTFVANASHELRTPLTVTSGYIDILSADSELPENLREAVAQMREQTDNMTQLISDLLTLSQLEGDFLGAFEGQPIEVAARLMQIINDIKNSKNIDQRTFTIHADAALGLQGIEREISSIMINLIDNAVKYTPPETKIEIHWRLNENKQAEFSVQDFGNGFNSEHIPLITKRFYRINHNTHARTEGTGLGLAIIKHAAQRHGGELLIDSQLGQYAKFTVIFPANRTVKLPVQSLL